MRTIFLYILWISCIITTNAQNFLFRNGKSDYSIVLTNSPSTSENTAAQELQYYIKIISDTTLPIVNATQKSTGKHIYVGWTQACQEPKPKFDDEKYTYKTIGNNLYIYGGGERGTMYGVYAFLENELGIHWYTSSFTHIPKIKQFLLNKLYHSESPTFIRRFDFFLDALTHNDWTAHNLLNSQYALSKSKYGNMTAYWGIHTFDKLMPPAKYFKSHPEYYSIYKGKRSDKAQLCLSNSDMRKELIKNLKNVIKDNPGYWCYDVSQNDISAPCECRSCQKLVKKYGGQSGIMIWFVNQVADEIKKVYPNIYIGTFAYRYTRQAPTSKLKVADNVVIRLCDIECCLAHPLYECSENKSFITDLNDWKKIAQNIYIWDYTTGFMHYHLPFPNLQALSKNLRFFAKSNVIGLMEEGGHDAKWNEFSEMKQWVIAKLLWNPNQDVDSLVQLFIKDYYGKSAPYIQQYYDLCNKQVTNNTHFTIKIDWNSKLYSDKFVNDGMSLMKQAINASSKNAQTLKRTKRVAAQLLYIKLRRNTRTSATDGTLKQFREILKEDETLVSEHNYKLENLLKDIGYK